MVELQDYTRVCERLAAKACTLSPRAHEHIISHISTARSIKPDGGGSSKPMGITLYYQIAVIARKLERNPTHQCQIMCQAAKPSDRYPPVTALGTISAYVARISSIQFQCLRFFILRRNNLEKMDICTYDSLLKRQPVIQNLR